MGAGFTNTYARCCEFESASERGVQALCDKVYQ